MNKPKINVSLKMPPELWDRFKTTCNDMGKSMSETTEDFCKFYVINRNLPQKQEILETIREELKIELNAIKTSIELQDNKYLTRIRQLETQLFYMRGEINTYKND